VHVAVRQVAGSDGDMGAVPRRTVTPDLDLGPGEGRRCSHNGCPDIPANVEHYGSGSAGRWQLFHGYGAADDTGVTLGFE
jgi:hypothetical protein